MLTSLNSEEAAASDETVAEALAYLLERSGTQEGQLAKLYSDLQCLADRFNERERQWTKLWGGRGGGGGVGVFFCPVFSVEWGGKTKGALDAFLMRFEVLWGWEVGGRIEAGGLRYASELNRLTITAEKRDEQIQSLYSSGLSLAESVRQHSDCIKYLEGCLTRLAESLSAIAKNSQNRPAQSAPATSANSLASWCRSWVGAARPTLAGVEEASAQSASRYR